MFGHRSLTRRRRAFKFQGLTGHAAHQAYHRSPEFRENARTYRVLPLAKTLPGPPVKQSDEEKMLTKALGFHGHDWGKEWSHGDFPRYTQTYQNAEEAQKYEDRQSDGIPSRVPSWPCDPPISTTPLPCDMKPKPAADRAADNEVTVRADLSK